AELAARGAEPIDFEELYGNVRKILYAIPQRRYGLSPEEADELVQDVWTLYLLKQSAITTPKSWLAGTMVNLCRQQIHQKCRSREIGKELQESAVVIDEQDPIERERTLILQQGLARLDERSRQLCVLIGMEGWSYEEVSEELAMPIGSVGPLYIRAKKKLRAAVEVTN
ncbi:MAG TPA: sigma-70 family RNA polymerase sigma factor, partial [Thermoanaerobaculia bacterium]|nr:sigma-70 family RNA polymerase sigma factor [Thermoanaerobaculia bacterium]